MVRVEAFWKGWRFENGPKLCTLTFTVMSVAFAEIYEGFMANRLLSHERKAARIHLRILKGK